MENFVPAPTYAYLEKLEKKEGPDDNKKREILDDESFIASQKELDDSVKKMCDDFLHSERGKDKDKGKNAWIGHVVRKARKTLRLQHEVRVSLSPHECYVTKNEIPSMEMYCRVDVLYRNADGETRSRRYALQLEPATILREFLIPFSLCLFREVMQTRVVAWAERNKKNGPDLLKVYLCDKDEIVGSMAYFVNVRAACKRMFERSRSISK